jgi:hypothetical protein
VFTTYPGVKYSKSCGGRDICTLLLSSYWGVLFIIIGKLMGLLFWFWSRGVGGVGMELAEGDSLLMEEYCLEIEGVKRGMTYRIRDKRFGYCSNVSLG